MANKMTVNDKFATVKAFLIENGADEDMVRFISERIGLQAKKNSGSKKPTKTQVENEEVKTEILFILSNEGMTATQVMASLSEEYAIQKVTALLTAMVKAGTIERTKDKKSVLFSLKVEEAEGE